MKLKIWVLVVLAMLGLAGPALAAPPPKPTFKTTFVAVTDAQQRCEALFGGQFNDLPSAPTQITKSTYYAATEKRVAYCSVEGYVNPTVKFGIYLPAENWNQKFLVRGCGGNCGTVEVELACKSHLRDGYACIHTDMGHFSTLSDSNWSTNNLQGQVDFGYRATHVVTVAGKAITTAFYKQDPRLSYYMGCSTGGRQGLVEVQRFPDDFDGVIVIAAAASPAGMAHLPRLDPTTFNLDANGKMILPPRKIYTIQKAAMDQCDKLDGLKDALITDPQKCHVDLERVKCKGADSQTCLTEAQIAIANQIYAAGAWPGAESDWMGKYIRLPDASGAQAARALRQMRGDPVVTGALFFAGNPDLRAFKAHGGKLLTAFGWNDPQIDPRSLIDYYDLTTQTMGGPDKTRDFFRLFLVPGMGHCSTGDGAYGINYIAELENWVEGGVAPEKIVGVHPTPGAPLDFFSIDLPFLDKKFVEFSRPHFVYPKSAYYDGKGDPNSADSFVAK